VFHVTEPEIKAQIPSEVYEAQVGLAEMVLDAPALAEAARECRPAG
jgi:glycine reductase complex selenoprotein A